jgi:hypothetical protein
MLNQAFLLDLAGSRTTSSHSTSKFQYFSLIMCHAPASQINCSCTYTYVPYIPYIEENGYIQWQKCNATCTSFSKSSFHKSSFSAKLLSAHLLSAKPSYFQAEPNCMTKQKHGFCFVFVTFHECHLTMLQNKNPAWSTTSTRSTYTKTYWNLCT